MFASVLPGIRELRVPLASGFLWLTLAWVWVGAFIPRPEDAEPGGLIDQFYRLADALGNTVVLAAIVFTAYLLGILMQFFQLNNLRILRRFRRSGSNLAELRATLRRRAALLLVDLEGMEILLHALTYNPDRRSSRQEDVEFESLSGGMPVNDVDPRLLLEDAQADTIRLMTLRVLEDIPMTAVQLQVQQKDLFGDYDRAQAEADFRLGIAVPLGLVILAIGVTFIDVEWWVAVIGGLIGALVTSVLVFRGLQKQSEANDIILRSIIIGAVEAPVFTLIQEALDLKANPSMVDEIRRHKTVRPRSTWQRLRRRFKAE